MSALHVNLIFHQFSMTTILTDYSNKYSAKAVENTCRCANKKFRRYSNAKSLETFSSASNGTWRLKAVLLISKITMIRIRDGFLKTFVKKFIQEICRRRVLLTSFLTSGREKYRPAFGSITASYG